jgi:hypothetical protein
VAWVTHDLSNSTVVYGCLWLLSICFIVHACVGGGGASNRAEPWHTCYQIGIFVDVAHGRPLGAAWPHGRCWSVAVAVWLRRQAHAEFSEFGRGGGATARARAARCGVAPLYPNAWES